MLYDRKLAAEVDGEDLGDEFKGYVFKIMGGQDKQGFPMKQGVLTSERVRLMMAKGALLPARTRGGGVGGEERLDRVVSHHAHRSHPHPPTHPFLARRPGLPWVRHACR